MWWLGTYGNVADARSAMCAMWGHILKDTESEGTNRDYLEYGDADDPMKESVDVLGVIPPLEDIGYMFGHDLASAGTGTDIFAVGMHSHDSYPDETLGRYEIEEAT